MRHYTKEEKRTAPRFPRLLGVLAKGANQVGLGPNAESTAAPTGASDKPKIPLVDPSLPAPTLKQLDMVWQRMYEAGAYTRRPLLSST